MKGDKDPTKRVVFKTEKNKCVAAGSDNTDHYEVIVPEQRRLSNAYVQLSRSDVMVDGMFSSPKTSKNENFKLGKLVLLTSFLILIMVGIAYLCVKISARSEAKMTMTNYNKGSDEQKLEKTKWFIGDFHQCPEGWIFNASTFACYYVSRETKTWEDALNICSNMSACLTNILSADEARWIGQLTVNDTWVGGRQHGMQHFWFCDKYTFNETSPHVSLWAPDQPSDKGITTNCIQLWKEHKFSLDDTSCYHKLHFVCKRFPGT